LQKLLLSNLPRKLQREEVPIDHRDELPPRMRVVGKAGVVAVDADAGVADASGPWPKPLRRPP
jgi:hypothetical protein